ncbi:MAG: ComEA family DNA-binding protein [Solirubrobacterales bacterium]|nr:ComEA family DNA-binding protein [Solirubrobacterales bacterium]
MPRINGQIAVYVAVGVVLLLVGLSSIRGEKDEQAAFAAGSSRVAAEGGERQGFSASGGSRRLVVDVAGAVRRPGVYRFPQGARVIDAIARAGGITGAATTGAINRAATLSDGQQVVVPSRTEAAAAGSGGGAGAEAPISLGTATQEQLEKIDGIGPVTAQKILEFRESQGGLGSVDDLDQVSGIGPVTMESLRSALAP